MVHGGDIYGYPYPVLDFSANANPLGIPKAALAAAADSLKSCVHYPDPLCRRLREEISDFEDVPAEWIVCGNGAADVLFRLVLAGRPQTALVLAPSFAEYEQALKTAGCAVRRHYLLEGEGFCLTERILGEMTPDLDMVFLCNPNNPTGCAEKNGLLLKILEKCRENNTLLVMDECFLPFLDTPWEYTLLGECGGTQNLFILKAFTKIFGMPGLRLGYGICSNQELLGRMRLSGQPWSVSIPAQEAGIQAVKERDYLEETSRLISRERQYLISGLQNLGFLVYGSQANYIFFRAPGLKNLKERLLEDKILIRSCGNYPGLTEEHYRVAVRTHEENEKLMKALEKALR